MGKRIDHVSLCVCLCVSACVQTGDGWYSLVARRIVDPETGNIDKCVYMHVCLRTRAHHDLLSLVCMCVRGACVESADA